MYKKKRGSAMTTPLYANDNTYGCVGFGGIGGRGVLVSPPVSPGPSDCTVGALPLG
ncbi:hypothetical protein [Sphingobacterium thalpophilum]|uniref:hypothetical protein n=1 Tax=Sphingobacterium thalpophilum TaxID=259 RepID=UPI003D994EEE